MLTSNALQLWIHSAVAKAVGQTLAHFVWEGAAIAVILAAVLAALRGASARLRYGLACLALAAMPVAFIVTLAVSLPHSAPRTIVPIPLPQAIQAPLPSADLPTTESWNVTSLIPWAAPLWLAGVFALLLYRFASWIAAQRLRRLGTCAAPEEWSQRFDALVAQLGISRPVALLESCLADVPMVIGYLRPVILIPIGLLAGLPLNQVEAILLHELAHIRRADYLVNLVQTLIESLLFYHPAVWWISSVVRAERENCCDDFVLARDTDPQTYAAALAALEQGRDDEPARVMALAANGGDLLRRVRRILGMVRQPAAQPPNLAIGPVALAILGAGIALAAWQPDVVKPATVAIITPAPAADAPESLPMISIQPDGKMYLGDKPVAIQSMSDEIARRYKGAKAVYVRADRETAYDPIAQVVSTLHLAKYDVKLVTPIPNRLVVSPDKSPRVLIAQAQPPQPMTDQQKKQRVEALQQESDRQMAAIRKEMESPYRKWLNEDVAYIITDAERKAFLSLTTDFDREQFIEQFWKRRDPTPDTERNEYKEEHYRRIAYANDHFKSGIPGWKTDRGRIYIGYGPPDEIDSHPSGGSYTRPAEQGGGTTSTYPFEKWRYRYIEGMGENIILEFVDGERNGEYRMTMDPTEKEKLLSSSQPPPLQIVQGIPSGPSDRGFGDKHAGVWIYPGGQVTLVIPLEGPGMNHIYARLKTAGGEVITYFEQDANPVNLNFVRNVVLKPGSYVFSAARMGRDGETEVVNFAVK